MDASDIPGGTTAPFVRSAWLQQGLDSRTMTGIEIGPWFSPVVPRADGWNTVVVDFSTSEELRERARSHTSDVIRALGEKIEDVDVVWSGESLVEDLLSRQPQGYDFLVASHVFEHLPDLIGFFRQLERIIKPGGVVSLAMPDRRICFDYFKPLTMTDDLLAAHREGRTRHTPETIFQAEAYQGWLNGNAAWSRTDIPDVKPVSTLRAAYAQYLLDVASSQLEHPPYVDAHVWIFVPANFSLVILELNVLGLIDFHVTRIIDSPDWSEFLVQLEHGRLALDDDAVEAERARLLHQMMKDQAGIPGLIAIGH